MANKIINVNLPEWAWLSGGEHEKNGDQLDGRDVVLHVRSASVIEFFEADNFVPNGNVQSHTFSYKNAYGQTERHIAVLHYCAGTQDKDIISDILVAATEWYCKYMEWEDNNIIADEIVRQN